MNNSPLTPQTWSVNKIAVIGPGIVGMPMAALLADAKIKIGSSEPAEVIVIQRNSKNSGWKVDAINSGKSVIGGIEPALDRIIQNANENKLLSASFDYSKLSECDVILVCVQTDKMELQPDYGPLFDSLKNVAKAIQNKSSNKIPLIIFESTLAPSTMLTLISDFFKQYNLVNGRDILLGNSPNRVMPGRLVERVKSSDKIIGGLNKLTVELIEKLYSNIVTEGKLYSTNSLTAEIVKTFENAYRDVRIAYSAEVVRYCDENNIDFYELREEVNRRLNQEDEAGKSPNTVPTGGILIPTVGVGGHCLPKDGILLWWRAIENNQDTKQSLIIQSRQINNNSPQETINLIERKYGKIDGLTIGLMGVAYRFNSEDTRNSPTLELFNLLENKNCKVFLHDPYVKNDDQNILNYDAQNNLTYDLDKVLDQSDMLIFCTAHQYYLEKFDVIKNRSNNSIGIVDACNVYNKSELKDLHSESIGIGKGNLKPNEDLINSIFAGFQSIENAVSLELQKLTQLYNISYAKDSFNKVDYTIVRELAESCNTGCHIVEPKNHWKEEVDNIINSELVELSNNKFD